MISPLPDWNTAPAMPVVFNILISPMESPMATRENSSSVLSSLRNSVERSALSIRVASLITLANNVPSSSSDVTSDTTSRNSISLARFFCIRSTNWVLCIATAAWVAMASIRFRSSGVNGCKRTAPRKWNSST